MSIQIQPAAIDLEDVIEAFEWLHGELTEHPLEDEPDDLDQTCAPFDVEADLARRLLPQATGVQAHDIGEGQEVAGPVYLVLLGAARQVSAPRSDGTSSTFLLVPGDRVRLGEGDRLYVQGPVEEGERTFLVSGPSSSSARIEPQRRPRG